MTALPRIRHHTDGRVALQVLADRSAWSVVYRGGQQWVHERHVLGDGWAELFVAELPKLDNSEAVFVTRAMLVAGMLVGITGESDAAPSMEQLDRAADLIMRAGRAHRIAMERVVDAIKQHREVQP